MPLLVRRSISKYERQKLLARRSFRWKEELDESLAALGRRDTFALDRVHSRDKMLYKANEVVQASLPLIIVGLGCTFLLVVVALVVLATHLAS